MAHTLPIGGTVVVPWNGGEVPARVTEVRGDYPRTEVVAQLSPGLSGPGIDPVTVTVPFRSVRWVRTPVQG